MQDLDRRSVRTSRALFAAVAFSFLMLLIAALVLFTIARVGEDADRSVAHTLEAKQAIAQLLTTIVSAEAGQRGFLVTGEAEFLAPYEAAHDSLPLQLDDLRSHVLDNSTQVARIDALQPIIAERLSVIENTLVLARQNRRAEVGQMMHALGEPVMNDIRRRIAELDATELYGDRKSVV